MFSALHVMAQRRRLSIVAVVILLGVVGTIATTFMRPAQAPRAQAPQRWIQNLGSVDSLVFFPDNRRFLTCGDAGRIAIYDVETGKLLQRWRAQADPVRLARDGSRLLTIKYPSPFFRRDKNEMTAYSLWDVATARTLRTWSMPTLNSFEDVSADLSLCAWRRGRQLEIVETASGRRVKILAVPNGFRTPRFMAGGRYLLVYGSGSSAQLFRISDWRSLLKLPQLDYAYLTRDAKTLLGLNREKHSVQFWNVATGAQRTQQFDLPKLRWVYPTTHSLVLSGSRPVRGSTGHAYHESVLQIRALDGLTVRRELKDDPSAYGREGRLLATGAYRNDGICSVYDTSHGSLVASLDAAIDLLGITSDRRFFFPSRRLALSNDGKWCVAGDNSGLIRIWRLPQGAQSR